MIHAYEGLYSLVRNVGRVGGEIGRPVFAWSEVIFITVTGPIAGTYPGQQSRVGIM
jgi:hypothetical protein